MKAILISVILVVGVITLLPTSTANAQLPQQQAQAGVDSISNGENRSLLPSVNTLINVFIFLIGTLSVLMIIYGGYRYVTSAGDTSAVSSAKNTILYAVVGVVVTLCAYAIVNFVITSVNDTDKEPEPNNTQQSPAGVGPTPM